MNPEVVKLIDLKIFMTMQYWWFYWYTQYTLQNSRRDIFSTTNATNKSPAKPQHATFFFLGYLEE